MLKSDWIDGVIKTVLLQMSSATVLVYINRIDKISNSFEIAHASKLIFI